jgi:hypothetical protein
MDQQRRLPQGAHTVRQVAVPPAARFQSTLSRIDYADAFVVDTGPTRDWTGEQWARAILQDAPIAVRSRLLAGWSAIGLKISRGRSSRTVLGWEVRASTAEFALLGARSRVGMPGELLFQPERGSLLFCTFVQLDNPVAHALWAAIEATHVRVVHDLLERAGQRLRSQSTQPTHEV